MFHLIKKDKERESLRKEKKEKKDRMSQADLCSLEEMSVRRGFFGLHRGASKRDSKTRLEISSPIPIKVASDAELSLTDIQAEGGVPGEEGGGDPHPPLLLPGAEKDPHRRGSVKERAAMFGPVLAKTPSQALMDPPPALPLPLAPAAADGFADARSGEPVQSPALASHPGGDAAAAAAAVVGEYPRQRPPPATRVPELVEKTFPGADLALPAVALQPPPSPRVLDVARRDTGDFGFSLRRTTLMERGADGRPCRRVVHFAEPGASTTRDRALGLGLVPGDRLVEINGVGVESRSRDDIVEMIRRSGDSVRLKVRPISELSELNLCWLRNYQDPPRRGGCYEGKTEEQLAAEQAWYLTDKVWLVHKDGFSLATLLKTEAGSLPEGKVKVRLDSDGSLLEVDEDDVEKANPPHLDRVEDLGSLRSLNESSVIHTLRQRYGGNLAHTHAGPHMVVLNPVSTPAMYSEKVMHMFKGCRREDTAPHIYAMAQTAYRSLLTTRQDQSVVLLGKSGSGKTTSAQHLVQYLVTIAGSPSRTFSAEKWQAVYTALEAFGHASTSLNPNASRFTHVVALDFDQAGQVTSASIQTMLLEKTRVTRRPEGEATFNVFYYLLAGVDSSMRTELHLNHFAENHAFGIAPHQKAEDKQRAAQQFSKLQAALKVLGVSGEEQKAFWLVLGAIYHLGAAGATKERPLFTLQVSGGDEMLLIGSERDGSDLMSESSLTGGRPAASELRGTGVPCQDINNQRPPARAPAVSGLLMGSRSGRRWFWASQLKAALLSGSQSSRDIVSLYVLKFFSLCLFFFFGDVFL
ncbi:unnamed protein product [Boreogadus saida]